MKICAEQRFYTTMLFYLDLPSKKLLMVSVDPLPNDTLWYKFVPNWAKGREIYFGQVIDTSDGQTDRH